MLEHEETLILIKKAQTGDGNAKGLLVEHNMPLIKSIVKRYIGRMIEYDDLIQLGSLGLIKAINNFNTDFGVRFSTYAVPMIAGEIKRFLRDDGSVKVSRALKALSQSIAQFSDDFKKRFDRDPTLEEIAAATGVEPAEAVFAMDSSRYPLSLTPPPDSDELSILDRLASNDDDIIDKMQIKEIIDGLPERERTIIILRYFRDKTQTEVARLMGVSQVQISRLEGKILEKLKANI
ncbi:MAG: sigma-70 family RNA polymerase sigma factor [Clostridiaceae bacterium]|jgi:RNA polymerase sporulation-specific sigma factor|nr:sigma-70 family RNA polymerase sigma factor [Clostridiaceae bacterium]